MVGLQHWWTGAEQTCAKHFDTVTCDTLLSKLRDVDMMGGLQQISHETGGIQIDTKQEEVQ